MDEVLLLPVAFFAGVDEATQLLAALQHTLQVKAVGWQLGAVQAGCFRVVFSGVYEGCRRILYVVWGCRQIAVVHWQGVHYLW